VASTTDYKFHTLLQRQLHRLSLDGKSVPTESQWRAFLKSINGVYIQSDQDRYLLERSLGISSREMSTLNEKLELAQHVAGLGFWFFDQEANQITFTNEIYDLLGLDPLKGVTKIEELTAFLDEETQTKFISLVNNAFLTGNKYELEFSIFHKILKTNKGFYTTGQTYGMDASGKKQLFGIFMDITDRKEAEKKLSELNARVIASAKQAGMAQIATSVLHNIGNVLNSANVSMGLLQENLNINNYKKLSEILRMVKDHHQNLDLYFKQDAKGKLIPEYLMNLLEVIINTYKIAQEEIHNLSHNIIHIKDIVTMQESFSGISGVAEKVLIKSLCIYANKMGGIADKNIEIVMKMNDGLEIMTDKSKLLQILINLFKNAKDSLMSSDQKNKKIHIKADLIQDSIVIQITDNGVGIPNENLKKIFTFGYTTKEKGHGFGLHSSILLAKELGGTLEASSDGLNQGATFSLKLPLELPLSFRRELANE
jgi:signal transduction histidine kinase